jgi:two-component system response regulator
MVVDDSQDDREITRRILAKAGRDVLIREAERGEEALRLLQCEDELPSLILLDLKMPGMSGIDTLRRIRADERQKRIPVIINTNSTLDSDRNASLNAGANEFVHKAFDLDQYRKDVQALLDRWLTG